MTNPFAQWIAQTRDDLGYTQKALAEMLGVSEAAVSRWVSGERTPNALMQDAIRARVGRHGSEG